jgi:hypothetical protein
LLEVAMRKQERSENGVRASAGKKSPASKPGVRNVRLEIIEEEIKVLRELLKLLRNKLH